MCFFFLDWLALKNKKKKKRVFGAGWLVGGGLLELPSAPSTRAGKILTLFLKELKFKGRLKMEKITENEFKQMTDGMRVENVADCLCELNKGIGYKIYTLLIAENEKTYETKYFCKIAQV